MFTCRMATIAVWHTNAGYGTETVQVTPLRRTQRLLPNPNAIVAFSALILLFGRQEGHQACKKWGDGGGGHCSEWMEWRPPGWLVCLPLLIFPCTIKSRSSLLAPAHEGGPGKRAVKRLWWWWLHQCWTTNHQQQHSMQRPAHKHC